MKNVKKVSSPARKVGSTPAGKASTAPKKAVSDAGPGKPAQRRLDWDRIERDHATGRFTDQELADAHGTARSTISVRRTRDRARDPAAWAVDRTAEVKRATAALLVQEGVNKVIAAGNTAESVMAAAHNAKDVILSHRHEIRDGREVSACLMAELKTVTTRKDAVQAMLDRASATMDEAEAAAFAAQAREFVKLHARVASMQKLADTMTRLHTLERKAFGIADEDGGANPLDTMNEGELQAEIDRLAAKLA